MSSTPTPKKPVPAQQQNQSKAQPVSSSMVNKPVPRPIFPSGRIVCDSQETVKKSPTTKK